MSHIKIALIDDHTLFRSGIKALLSRQNDFEVIGEAADGLSGVKLVAQTRPDIVLLDLDMPVMNGREALAQILSAHPEQTVVMLTVSEDSDDLTECMRLGARLHVLAHAAGGAGFLRQRLLQSVQRGAAVQPQAAGRGQGGQRQQQGDVQFAGRAGRGVRRACSHGRVSNHSQSAATRASLSAAVIRQREAPHSARRWAMRG